MHTAMGAAMHSSGGSSMDPRPLAVAFFASDNLSPENTGVLPKCHVPGPVDLAMPLVRDSAVDPSPCVDLLAHRFKMKGLTTLRVSAQVVQDLSFRGWPHGPLVYQPVEPTDPPAVIQPGTTICFLSSVAGTHEAAGVHPCEFERNGLHEHTASAGRMVLSGGSSISPVICATSWAAGSASPARLVSRM